MNKYLKYTPEQMEEHLSGYLIDSWSYSGVQCFARNEKAFEMQYIYCENDRKSISAMAGSAYHEALKEFFSIWKPGVKPEFVALTAVAYGYLDEVPANDWKTTDTFPTAEAAKAEATSKVNNLLKYFCEEVGTYTGDIAEVLHVETRFEEWVTVNGVDIPLPLHAVIDLVARLKNGKVVIIDHKSKSKFTDEADPKGLVSFFYIGCRRVVGRLRQSSASLHPPSGTSFLREPLTRPRPATLCRTLPATTQLTSLPVFQQQVPYFEPACAWTLLYKQHTS